jgi:hypothetical protein
VTSVKEAIAEHFEDQARWRREKGAEHPDDSRNVQCGDGLKELAAFVRGLPDDDERIVELGVLGFRDGIFDVPSGDSAQRAISHFRFYQPNQDCDRFLSGVAPLLRHDMVRLAEFAGEL